MLKVSMDNAAHVEDHGAVVDRYSTEGNQRIDFITFNVEMDNTPLLKGLPGDHCTCPHWGYVLKGRLRFKTDDGEEVFEAGDAFYVEPGHIPFHDAGTEYIQFSPADELQTVSEHIVANFQAMQAGQPG